MHSVDRAKYLANRQRRTHFAIKCKRVMGEWIPQSGPIEDAEKMLTQMQHGLINYRAGIETKPSAVQNFMGTLQTASDRRRTLEIFGNGLHQDGDKRRRKMTARRIMKRLGMIKDREDDVEKKRWSEASLGKWEWFTVIDLPLEGGLRLMAGTQVYYLGDGRYGTDSDREIVLSAEEARQAGVRRWRASRPRERRIAQLATSR